jgi:hypothetical protein
MTRAFSDTDDIGGTPHLVENRFRLNGAAAIFEIIHTQEFPVSCVRHSRTVDAAGETTCECCAMRWSAAGRRRSRRNHEQKT